MAFIILLSSLGYSLDVHYCGDEIFEISVLGDITSCQEKDQGDINQEKITKKGCCDLEHMSLETSSQYQLSSFDVDQSNLNGITFLVVYSQIRFIKNVRDKAFVILDYPQTLYTNKVYKKNESFLI